MHSPTPPRAPTPTLIIFAKAPTPGRVKTRLTEVLTEKEAAALYEAFLRDTLTALAALAGRCGVALRLYHAGPRWPAALTPEGATVHRQQPGAGLGARMAAAFRETFDDGAGAALIVGTDHPTLPPAFVEQGIAAVQQDREAVCIGPTEDGGFYLLGTGRPRPALSEGMTYSHAEVFSQTLARAVADADVPPVVLPEWYDVDRPADLRRLAAELAEGDADRAPHTHRCLGALTEAYPGALRPTSAGAE